MKLLEAPAGTRPATAAEIRRAARLGKDRAAEPEELVVLVETREVVA